MAAALALGGSRVPARAASPQQCTARWDGMLKQRQASTRGYQAFMAGCLAGSAPAVLPTIDTPQTAPEGATARCRDGAYTTSTVRLAACEHHRGVAAVLRPAPPAGPTEH